MPKTVGDILTHIDEVLPNALSTSLKLTYLDEIVKGIRYCTPDVTYWTTQTVANQHSYSLPTNINIRDIITLHITDSTYNSTTVVSSTLDWTQYEYAGYEDRNKGLKYYRASSGGSLCLSPVPDDVVYFKALHWSYPGTSGGTTSIIVQNDYLAEYVQSKLLAKIAKSGVYPRIDLANNYELDALESLTKVKLERGRIERELKNRFKGYKDWW